MSDIHDTRRYYVGDIDDLDGLTRSEVEDMTFEYYWQADDHAEEFLTEVFDTVDIGGMVFDAGTILRNCDPIAFRCTVNDMTAEVDLLDYPEDEDEDEDI